MTEANAESVTRTATALLLKILSNIQKRPEELKYRRIRKENKQISGGVLVARGALALLTAVGFEPAEEGESTVISCLLEANRRQFVWCLQGSW